MIRKLILILSILFINNSILANDFYIKSIEVNGLERIERETVILYSKLNIGDLYSNDLGNDTLKELFKTDLFSDVQIEYIDGLLNISVKENPTINFIKFDGNDKKNDEDL